MLGLYPILFLESSIFELSFQHAFPSFSTSFEVPTTEPLHGSSRWVTSHSPIEKSFLHLPIASKGVPVFFTMVFPWFSHLFPWFSHAPAVQGLPEVQLPQHRLPEIRGDVLEICDDFIVSVYS